MNNEDYNLLQHAGNITQRIAPEDGIAYSPNTISKWGKAVIEDPYINQDYKNLVIDLMFKYFFNTSIRNDSVYFIRYTRDKKALILVRDKYNSSEKREYIIRHSVRTKEGVKNHSFIKTLTKQEAALIYDIFTEMRSNATISLFE